MALGPLPYTAKITGKVLDGAGTGWVLAVQISDGAGTILSTGSIDVGQAQPFTEIRDAILNQIGRQMESDAGGRSALLDLIVSSGVRIQF